MLQVKHKPPTDFSGFLNKGNRVIQYSVSDFFSQPFSVSSYEVMGGDGRMALNIKFWKSYPSHNCFTVGSFQGWPTERHHSIQKELNKIIRGNPIPWMPYGRSILNDFLLLEAYVHLLIKLWLTTYWSSASRKLPINNSNCLHLPWVNIQFPLSSWLGSLIHLSPCPSF